MKLLKFLLVVMSALLMQEVAVYAMDEEQPGAPISQQKAEALDRLKLVTEKVALWGENELLKIENGKLQGQVAQMRTVEMTYNGEKRTFGYHSPEQLESLNWVARLCNQQARDVPASSVGNNSRDDKEFAFFKIGFVCGIVWTIAAGYVLGNLLSDMKSARIKH